MTTDLYRRAGELACQKVRFAVATVVRVVDSSSAKPGSKAIIDENGKLLEGWVGGGCAESAVRTEAQKCITEDRTAVIMLDLMDEVLGVGMPCGGQMEVYIEPVLPKPKLVLVGHGRITEVLATLGHLMHFSVTVSDPAAKTESFPEAERLITEDLDFSETPMDRNTYTVIATQHKNDHLWVKKALEGDAVYMALVASQKRSKLVLEYALSAGVPADKLERVRAPAGLDLGASTPEEIALSIMSEIIAVRRGATGQPLRDRLQKGPKESASVAKVISQCET